MDTGTHIVMGVAIGGLATLDPVVANDPTLFNAVFIGAIIGSQAPDFDTILKLKNNAIYIRHHRGFTHSIPAMIIWGILIASIIYMFVPQVDFLHLWAWTFIAVILHAMEDVFNAYGTQVLRPFSNRWVAYGFINTFDPYIFLMHIAGIVAWFLGANPGYTWFIIYVVLLLYYIKRYMDKREIVQMITDYYQDVEQVVTSPTVKQNNWRVAVATPDHYYVGTVENGHIQIDDKFDRIPLPKTPLMQKAQHDKNISAFLSFSPIYRWEITEYEHYTEIRFIDLRYRSKGHYSFVAVVQINSYMQLKNSYTGWIFSERKLQNKLFSSDNPI